MKKNIKFEYNYQYVSIRVLVLVSLSLILGSLKAGEAPTQNLAASMSFINELHRAVTLVPSSASKAMTLQDASQPASPELSQAFQRILDDPEAARRLGIVSNDFKATWYIANPYDMLPESLKTAIHRRKRPFRSRGQMMVWLENIGAPPSWRRAVRLALIETTSENLWRASRKLAPFAKNGQYLQPVAYQSPTGELILRKGHVATDPRVIPTNSELLLIIEAGNERRFVLAKATDVGSRVHGHHIDIPIHLSPLRTARLPHLRFPKELSHPRVTVVFLGKLLSDPRKFPTQTAFLH